MAFETRALLVVFGAFLCRFLDNGTSKSFGVLLHTLTDQFDIMVWRVGNTVSLTSVVGTIVAVLISPIINIVGTRGVMVVCGILTASGFIFVSYAEHWITISFILICLCGVGFRCAGIISIGVLPEYFDKHLLIASGFVFSGSSIGPMVFAPLTQLLLDTYGWRSTFLLLGATCFNMIVCGLVIKPRPKSYTRRLDQPSVETSSEGFRCGPFLKTIYDNFNLQVFSDFRFIALLSTDLAVTIAWQSWIIYLVPYAEQKGFTPYEATALTSIGSLAFPMSLWISALMVDTGILTDSHVRFGGLLVTCASFTVSPWVNSMIGQSAITFLGIAAIGACYITSISVATSVSADNFTQIIAYEMAASVVGKYLGGLISGLLYDVSGTYDVSFLFVGGCLFAAAMIQGLAIVLERRI